jgi:hypothetical protein
VDAGLAVVSKVVLSGRTGGFVRREKGRVAASLHLHEHRYGDDRLVTTSEVAEVLAVREDIEGGIG